MSPGWRHDNRGGLRLLFGDFQPQITNTWLGLVGPGVDQAGQDSVTFSDHTNVRPTLLTLVGLTDDYEHEGRALVEKLDGWAQPPAVKQSANFVALAQALKQINAPVGPFGLASLHASTVAMESGSSADDSTYASIERQLASFTAQRDALAAQITSLLEAAQFNGTPIPDATAASLIQQAQNLLTSFQTYADSLQQRTPELLEKIIGIGGRVTPPPLPHHRTCGSAYGGSADAAKPAQRDEFSALSGTAG